MSERPRYGQVDRRAGLSVREFKREYRDCGMPVVLLDAVDDWKARVSWTFGFFKSHYGEKQVQVFRYQRNHYHPNKVKQMSLGEYIDGVSSNDWESFPYYIRDNWKFLLDHPELSADFTLPKYFFDWFSLLPSFMRLPYPRIFMGPKGAVTPLHQDIWGTHAWLTQLVGRKRWIFIRPEERRLVYDFQVQPENPDFSRFPLFRQAKPLECTIGPGETVFVPGGWIHYVVSLDPTISLSSNYMGPGCFSTTFPHAVKELVLKRIWDISTRWIGKPVSRAPGVQ